MKPSHIKTPRTLADATFVTGHARISIEQAERIAGRLLAAAIGVALTLVLVYGGRL